MRRMAGEQERLADRARRLRQALQDQTADRNGPGARKAADSAPAAAVRICNAWPNRCSSRRTRCEARALPTAGRRRRDRAVTHARRRLFSVNSHAGSIVLADRLNPSAAKDDESRKLSEQLARAQELREKLNQLGRALETAGQPERPPGDSSRRRPAKAASG